jgi:hypothetical protein
VAAVPLIVYAPLAAEIVRVTVSVALVPAMAYAPGSAARIAAAAASTKRTGPQVFNLAPHRSPTREGRRDRRCLRERSGDILPDGLGYFLGAVIRRIGCPRDERARSIRPDGLSDISKRHRVPFKSACDRRTPTPQRQSHRRLAQRSARRQCQAQRYMTGFRTAQVRLLT